VWLEDVDGHFELFLQANEPTCQPNMHFGSELISLRRLARELTFLFFFHRRFPPPPSASPPGKPRFFEPPPPVTPSIVIEGGLKIFLPSADWCTSPLSGAVAGEEADIVTGAEKNVAEVLGALDTGLKPPGRVVDVVEVVADSPPVYGLADDACTFGFRDAAGANLRAADHPVLLTADEDAADPNSCLMITGP